MPPKQRSKENKRYPANWRVRQRGNTFTIFFRVPVSARELWDNRSEVTLGKGATIREAESKAYQEWADKMAVEDTPMTMGDAFKRYQAEVIPEKSLATQRSNIYSMARLRAVIPLDMPVVQFRTHHACQYQAGCAKAESTKKANLDIEVLSHVFTKCLYWGTPDLIEHPIRGKMNKLRLPPRDRYIKDWELDAFLSTASPMLKVYVPLKLALGIDQQMMLAIKRSDIKEDRLSIPKRTKIKDNHKAKAKDYLFYDEDGESTGLKELLDNVIAWRTQHSKVTSNDLFCNKYGQSYVRDNGIASGFHSVWRRSMDKALKLTELSERFTEHDITAKTASDAETLEQAAKLRGHLDKATTQKTYRRKAETVLPLKRK